MSTDRLREAARVLRERAEAGRCAECRSKGWHKMDCSQRRAES